jgi:hypothetical protein
MEDFSIHDVVNTYLHYAPNPTAKYGIAFSFGRSNVNDLIFACELIDKSWINKEFIEISVASFLPLSDEVVERLKKVTNYIVKVERSLGHQNGTTAHANAALYPLMHNENIELVAHTDSDVPWLNQTYFFGFCQMLRDSGKFILTSQDTYLYDLNELTTSVYTQHDIPQTEQFGSMFIFPRQQALDSGYFPLSMEGHFERDRYTHFVRCGFNLEKDALLIKRAPIDVDLPPNFLYSFDVNLGVCHQTNCIEFPEKDDRKVRMLQLMYTPAWEDMTLGFKQHHNPKSPRQNYGPQ